MILAVLASVAAILTTSRESRRVVLFGLAWFVITLSPYFVPIADPMAEHRLYMPMVGLVIALGGWRR